MCRDGENDTVGTETRLGRVFLKAVGERNITAQETSRLLLGGKFSSSTFNYKRLNISPDQQSQVARLPNGHGDGRSTAGGGQRAPGVTPLKRYSGRASSAAKYPEVMSFGAFHFTRRFRITKGDLQPELNPAEIIVINLPAIGAAKG